MVFSSSNKFSTPCEVLQDTMPDFCLKLYDQTAVQGQTVEFHCQIAGIYFIPFDNTIIRPLKLTHVVRKTNTFS